MLTVPARDRIGDLTIYGDDTEFFRFYALPTAPRLRLDADGDPVFLLVAYAGEAVAPGQPASGGGYIAFDTAFEALPAEVEALKSSLQPLVDAEWERLRAGTADEKARPGVAGTVAPPRVELSTPTFIDGGVKMNAPQSASLVTGRVAEGEASLLTGNIASFSLDLTPAGASFMESTLVGNPADGAGQSDETPIQVAYDLTFWARLPPARIHLEVDGERMHSYVEQQIRGRGVNSCTGRQLEDANVDEESLTMSGAVTVQIDTGSGSISDEVVAELRAYAFDVLKQLVASTFFTAEGEPPPAPAASTAAAKPTTRLLLRRRRYGTRRVVARSLDKKTMSIKLDLEQRSVVPWSIHPTGTLQTLLGGDPAARARHVRRIRVDDPFFATLQVSIQVFTAFQDIDHAEVEIEYEASDENGVVRRASTAPSFTTSAPIVWSTPVIGGERRYRWRYRSVLKGGRATEFSPWETRQAPQLIVSIVSPGRLSVEVLAGAIDFKELVSQVQVRLAYEDAANGVPRAESVVLLTAEKPRGSYERVIDAPQAGPLMSRLRFDLRSGDVVEESEWHAVEGPQLLVNQPTESVLRVSLLPAGDGWAEVAQAWVNLRYEDPANGIAVNDMFTLKGLDSFATWQVYLKDREKRNYRFQWQASFKGGQFIRRDWQDNPGDPLLPITVKLPGIRLMVTADALDLAACPLTEVTITHDIPGGKQKTLIFNGKTAQFWDVEAPEGAPVAFRYTVTHFPVDRDPVVLPERRETDTIIVLPLYRAVAAGQLQVQLLAQLVDFNVTPIVAVDLRYEDAEYDLDLRQSFTFNDGERAAAWRVATRDASRIGFTYRTTYFLADGTEKAGDWMQSTIPRVVVPRYQAH
ncbi:hypothetical protein G3545_21990 [Starkeya sp. ORNL1]|uniref:hypothetical protein n=1 Tax=Starkeya sp. ORNL1 TaxID=2709380 RepID=UPI001462AE03|nr:hypothetical protein [Starkeya sp. ORNL1]QJP16077.1 hypothetical protein G3545_21990 [Starkeya sp. ORNL1]